MKNIFWIFPVLLIQVACSAPVQTYSDHPLPTVVAQIPEVMLRGKENVFFVSAISKSVCHLGIGYYNLDSQWTTVNLPDAIANSDDKCESKWLIPRDAKNGIAEVRGYIVSAGQEDINLFPQEFCIEKCP